MKRNIINKCLVVGAFAALGGMMSCNDFLTLYPTDSITKEDFWASRNDVDNVRNAAYYQLTQNTNKILIWGEFRSDNVELNKTEKNEFRRLQEGVLQPTENIYDWASMYKGINLCNEVLDNGERMVREKVDPAFTESDFAPVKSEMLALRALYYFYLVRAYRNVPLVLHSVDTDKAAREARIAATPGDEVLNILIQELEANLSKTPTSYGSNEDNKNRFTRNGVHTLLADMYLWRAGLVFHSKDKGFPLKGENGAELTQAQEEALSQELLKKCVEHTNPVMDEAWKTYKEFLSQNNIQPDDYRAKVRYPLYRNSDSKERISDDVYEMIFGRKNSAESIFELGFDGTNVDNGTLSEMFYSDKSGNYAAGVMVAGSGLFNVTEKVDVTKGYGITDLRMASYGDIAEEKKSSTTPIIKGVATTTTGIDITNTRAKVDHSKRRASFQNANWPIYRLTDIMTIRAEAIARLSSNFNNPAYSSREAFMLADDIFRRNNPGADTSNVNSEKYSKRIRSDKFENDVRNKAADAEKEKKYNEAWNERHADYGNNVVSYVLFERQREFLGEGKRWFDLVRDCEFKYNSKTNKNKSGLESAGLSTSVRNRLQSIWSLYNPIFVDELKVNGKNYFGNTQGQLVQNPAWEKYMPKSND